MFKDIQLHQVNQSKIEAMKQNKFFSHPLNNKIGLEYAKYLLYTRYHSLTNPDPINPQKNSLAKEFNYLKVVDSYIQKPLNEIQPKDIDKFCRAILDGKLKSQKTTVHKTKNGVLCQTVEIDKPRSKNNLTRYIHSFKRYWRVYREFVISNTPEQFKPLDYEWALNYRSPRIKHEFENYPVLSLNKIITISERLCKPEYTARMLLSVNLMGRKCELSELQLKDIEFRENGKVFVKLPNVKKVSGHKVPVELYSYAKNKLLKHLEGKNLQSNDKVFISKESAFAKELKTKSVDILGNGEYITPKTLRKLGVCVARELGLGRDTVEDIGGWTRNSMVLEHYFKREGVSIGADYDKKAKLMEAPDMYSEFDKMKTQHENAIKQMDEMRQMFLQSLLNRRDDVDVIKDRKEMQKAFETLSQSKSI